MEELLGSSRSEDPTIFLEKKHPKVFLKSFQNHPEIHPKFSQNSFLELSWALLAPLLGPLGAKRPQERKKTEKLEFGPPPLGLHFGRVSGPCWRYVGPGCAPRAHGNHILWPCTSKLTLETLTWPKLSTDWPNLGPTWANLAHLDIIFRRFLRPCWHPKSIKIQNLTKELRILEMCTAPAWEHDFQGSRSSKNV